MTLNDNLAIGTDIGGTKIAHALVNGEGHVISARREPTMRENGADDVIARVITGIEELLISASGGTVAAIGVGCPGHVDADGTVRSAALVNWQNVPL